MAIASAYDRSRSPNREPDSGPPSGRHAAIQLDEPVVAETSLRLASGDPSDAPEGYPIKADTKSGLYWTPGQRSATTTSAPKSGSPVRNSR